MAEQPNETYERQYQAMKIAESIEISTIPASPATLSIPLPPGFANTLPHNLVGYTFTDGAGLEANVAQPTAGTLDIQVVTDVNPNGLDEVIDGIGIDAALPTKTLTFNANPVSIELSQTGIDVATHVIIRVHGNLS